MAANNSLQASLNLTQLDFFNLKNSFKNYLKGQEQFKDYDFDGSALNVLLEQMAYNTYKNAFFVNMLHSEAFLDSAQLRTSLFSHCKELNYLPRSKRSAKAKVNITFEATGESQPYIVQKGNQFATLIKNESYTFSIPETLVVASANNTYTFTTDIYEGIYNKDSYIFTGSEYQRFKITNKNVDTNSITVTIYEDGDLLGTVYTLTTTLLDLNNTSKVFFLQTSETGHYEIYFGDNVLGRQPKINSTIIIDYRISQGVKGNGARLFSVDFDPTSSNELTATPTLEVIEAAKNGADEETNASIRYYAPRAFQVQERTVTSTDYEIALKTQFPEINAVSVYGGEEIDPPRFGKVFVAVDIADVEGLPESKITEYFNFLKRRSAFSIDPIIVEPDISYLRIISKVRYNLNVTTNSTNRIKTLVTNTILDYNDEFLNNFNVTLRNSQLVRRIDSSDVSIISNYTDAHVYKKISPVLGAPQNMIINLGVPLLDSVPTQESSYESTDLKSVYSSVFKYNGENAVLEDDGNGIIRIVKVTGSKLIKITDIGTVNYSTGIITLLNFGIESISGPYLKVYGVPKDKDISISRNTILTLESNEIVVNVEALRI